MNEINETLEDRAHALVARMTLEEKARLCSGANFWELESLEHLGLSSITVTDGPHGLRKQRDGADHLGLGNSIPATCFPSLTALASSWDRPLLERVGQALGQECAAENVAVLLGPGINMKRHPLCGRNFEYFSEDPLLTGHLAAAWIRGVQSVGVGSCLKHFAAYNQETRRMIVDVVVDERSLREIYLRGFEIAIELAQPWSLMTSYNRINGSYASDNEWLLKQVLRTEWGYRGMVVSDWMGTNDRVRATAAGLDLEMPGNGGLTDAQVVAAVSDGRLAESDLDRSVSHVVELMLKAQQRQRSAQPADLQGHHALAREAAARSAVLLKNERNALPLRAGQQVAVIGAFARQPRFQGGGSSHVNAAQVDNAWDNLLPWAGQAGAALSYASGYDPVHSGEDAALIEEARATADRADMAVVFVGLPESCDSEIADRRDMSLPAQQNRLVRAVAATGTPTAVVLHSGGPVELAWLDEVAALLTAHLAGQASGSAIADLLVGRVNPSGKLAETSPLRQDDALSDRYFPGATPRQVQYREGLYIGYRYFNTVDKAVAFPFGHGLSYTEFAYSDAALDAPADGALPEVARVTVTNRGGLAGEEVVQVYLRAIDSQVHRPAQQLAGFAKVALAAGESAELVIPLDVRAFHYYDCSRQQWLPNGGEYQVEIGSSSRCILARLPVAVPVPGAAVDTPDDRFFRALSPEVGEVPEPVFAAMLGHAVPAPEPTLPFTRNSTLAELEQTRLGRKVAAAFTKKMLENIPVDPDDEAMHDILQEAIRHTPLRAMALASNGQLSFRILDTMIHLLNLRPLRALAAFFFSS